LLVVSDAVVGSICHNTCHNFSDGPGRATDPITALLLVGPLDQVWTEFIA